jgi:hypothetical protein
VGSAGSSSSLYVPLWAYPKQPKSTEVTDTSVQEASMWAKKRREMRGVSQSWLTKPKTGGLTDETLGGDLSNPSFAITGSK